MTKPSSKAYVRWPPEVAQANKAVLEWCMANSTATPEVSALSAAIALMTANTREDFRDKRAEAPDGRTVKYGARFATVNPKTGDFLGAGPWTYDLQGMDAVWRYVSETAWQLFDGMEALPIELTHADLSERTNVARVSMSRRADGVAVIRVRFTYQKRQERRSLKRGSDANEVTVFYTPEPAQLNIWVGPNEKAREIDTVERASRHPLAVAYME